VVGLAAVVAVALWPHSHQTSPPAGSAGPTPVTNAPIPTSQPSKAQAGPSTTPSAIARTRSAAAQNLRIPDSVRVELLTAFVAAKKAQPSEITGPVPGSVYYGYLPATDTYWAVADFSLSPTASQQTQINFQDGGSRGIFHHRAGQPWLVTIGDIPWPCPGDLPDAMRSVWNLPISRGCSR
jgi:hypothetical protein